MDKQKLDKYLTQEPNNDYQDWCEKVMGLIPESEISTKLYDKYEDFIDKLLEGMSKNGFPGVAISAERIIKAIKALETS